MPRFLTFTLFLFAVFLQAGAYGLTFMLPRLFETFGADEKAVGVMLVIAALSTLVAVYYAGHLSDWFGRVRTLGLACLAIAAAVALYGMAETVGAVLVLASLLLGAGWGLTYALAPVVLTRLVTAEERVRYFALNSVVLMAGFGLSPVMASEIEKAGGTVADAFLITAGLCVLSALVFFVLIGPVRAHAINPGPEASSRLDPAGIRAILRTRALVPVIMVCIGASVFAGMNNFQTVFADAKGLDYANFFLAYTITVVVCRIALARFKGGRRPYLTIAALLYVMAGSFLLFIFTAGNVPAYVAGRRPVRHRLWRLLSDPCGNGRTRCGRASRAANAATLRAHVFRGRLRVPPDRRLDDRGGRDLVTPLAVVRPGDGRGGHGHLACSSGSNCRQSADLRGEPGRRGGGARRTDGRMDRRATPVRPRRQSGALRNNRLPSVPDRLACVTISRIVALREKYGIFKIACRCPVRRPGTDSRPRLDSQRARLPPGETLVARIEDDRLVLEKPESVEHRIRERFRKFEGRSLARELIGERRAEARRENEP